MYLFVFQPYRTYVASQNYGFSCAGSVSFAWGKLCDTQGRGTLTPFVPAQISTKRHNVDNSSVLKDTKYTSNNCNNFAVTNKYENNEISYQLCFPFPVEGRGGDQ